MLVPTPNVEYEIEYDELATLKHLADEGCIERALEFSNSSLGNSLGVSTQTVSRRLRELDDAGLLDREMVPHGQRIAITTAGIRALKYEQERYNRIFDQLADIALTGTVTEGLGEGQHFVSLPGYVEQFRNELGYSPYPGTLNIDLNEESTQRRTALSAFDNATRIEGWTDDGRTYGPATCYPITLRANGNAYRHAHIIDPERTHHDESQLEVIAPGKLRSALALDDGDTVTAHVES